MLALGHDPVATFALMASFNLRPASLASIAFKATPLIFAGLAAAMAFRVNLWNIGVEGQYYIGAFAAAMVGFGLRGLPAVIHLPLTILAGVAGGVLWALPPILLRLRRGAHEVITTIMMNYIALALVHYLLADVFRDPAQAGTPRIRTPLLAASARMPGLHDALALAGIELPGHSALNWLLPVGILLCVALALLLSTTRAGYEVRAVAHGAGAAEAAGIPLDRVHLMMFAGSGALAGLVGLNDLLGFFGYFDVDFPKGLGFLGISVALLAKNHPVGIIFAALLFGYLDRGAEGIQVFSRVPREVITILQAVTILAIVVAYEGVSRYLRALRTREAAVPGAATPGPEAA
ncbi:MAG: ABC transporter permease [Armatimonadetes bacterium]|nr:ABC transporter permease [Armatimonadota bacterium]